jgi:PadR family transcriptional regulator PadR
MADQRSEILQGTLDLMVLKTLDAMGPLHGYGIAKRIEQVSEAALQVNQGTIYLCLVRLLHKKWISAQWGTSDNNRRARFYSITKAGRRQLRAEADNWARVSGTIARLLQLATRE